MPCDDRYARCAVCGWTYAGEQARVRFEQHMQEHAPSKHARFTDVLTEADRKMLRSMRIASWE